MRWFWLVFVVLIPLVNALDFQSFQSIFFNYNLIQYITFILFFILIYGIAYSGLKRVKVFEDKKLTKIISLVIAFGGTFSIFFTLLQTRSATEMLNLILKPFGIFGTVIIAGLIFT